jgi:predicted nucleotidyltransferase
MKLTDIRVIYDGHMSELDLLARQVGASARTLRRAVDEGMLRGERSSPRRLKLSAAEKDYVLGRWPLLARLRAALRTEPNVRFALLFGSTARGEDTETSDVDLLVETRDVSLVRLIDLELKLEALLGRNVDLLSLAEVESNPLLFGEALREGRVIVDREDRWAGLHSRAARSERRARDQARRRSRRAVAGIEALLTS